MIGLLLVTHGRLADEFLATLEYVVGPQTQIEAISIVVDDDMGHRRQYIVDAVGRVADGKGAVRLTDMFGGTPSNLAISVIDSIQDAGPVEVIAGLNLPMLIKLAQARGDMDFPALVDAAQAAGRKYISVASALLSTKPA